MPLSNRVCFQVNLRDALRCRVCGRAPTTQQNYHSGFEYHHVVPQSQGGTDDAANIILLCHDCHTLHHQGRLQWPHFDDLTPPATFLCRHCREPLETETVEMNCGWYRCPHCRRQTHLWDHCDYGQERAS